VRDRLWERLQVSKVIRVQFINKSAPDTDITMTIYAASQILKDITFSDKIITDIENLILKKESFQEEHLLKFVTLSTGSVLEGNFLFLIAKASKLNLDFGILFDKIATGGYHILGIWPRDFAEECREDQEIFTYFLYRLINTPDYFANVTLYRPTAVQTPDMVVKHPTQELAPPVPMQAPPSTRSRPTPYQATSFDVTSVIQTQRCPHCNVALPAPRVQTLEHGGNTFCPNCYNIIKGSVIPGPPPQAPAPPSMAPPVTPSGIKQLNLPRFLEPFLNSLQNPGFLLESALLYILSSLNQLNMEMRKIYNKNMTEIEKRKDVLLRMKNQIMASNDTTAIPIQFKLPAYSASVYPILGTHFQDLIIYGLLKIMEWLGLVSPTISILMGKYEQIFSQVRQSLP
ncbi:MAG: hypothetical protein HWN66_14135, partial [Candidatus Helarchaeota archaeon]|nr:hypothetical protein [Candidatus Helarchaeota archaeon]